MVDGIRNYMTKLLQNEWMVEKGLYEVNKLETQQGDAFFEGKSVKDLHLKKADLFQESETNIGQALDYLKTNEYMVIMKEDKVVAYVT